MNIVPRVDLSRWESLYDTFDAGHRRDHMERVREFAILLAQKYCPEKVELAFVAATLHDIGLAQGREGHEERGALTVATAEELIQAYSSEEVELIVEAVREHRASTGSPKSTIAKIVSDADKTSDSTKTFMQRAYRYGLQNFPELTDGGQVIRAASHLSEKFGPGGTGTRLYFHESEERLSKSIDPIISAMKRRDVGFLKSLVE